LFRTIVALRTRIGYVNLNTPLLRLCDDAPTLFITHPVIGDNEGEGAPESIYELKAQALQGNRRKSGAVFLQVIVGRHDHHDPRVVSDYRPNVARRSRNFMHVRDDELTGGENRGTNRATQSVPKEVSP
jgi:hypothetical protein